SSGAYRTSPWIRQAIPARRRCTLGTPSASHQAGGSREVAASGKRAARDRAPPALGADSARSLVRGGAECSQEASHLAPPRAATDVRRSGSGGHLIGSLSAVSV